MVIKMGVWTLYPGFQSVGAGGLSSSGSSRRGCSGLTVPSMHGASVEISRACACVHEPSSLELAVNNNLVTEIGS